MPPFLRPPPDDAFDSKEAGLKFAQTWARAEGYAIVIYASSKKGRYNYLRCDRGSKYRNTRKITDEDRQRKTSTTKIDCKFRARLVCNSEGGWELSVQEGAHTDHGPTESCLSHSIQRRFDALTTERVLELARTGSRVRQVVSLLQEQVPPVLVTSRDVSNLISKYRRQLLEGRPPAEALLDWLKEQSWPFIEKRVPVSENADRLEGLLFAHPRGIELLSRFGGVVVIDATYSTNQHRLPLLHIVGFTSSNRTFTAALAFLPNETTVTYTWARQALQLIAPTWEPDVLVTDEDAALSAALINS
ncbi:hypothetical protein CF335_g9761, partial [Tilletia laevis]